MDLNLADDFPALIPGPVKAPTVRPPNFAPVSKALSTKHQPNHRVSRTSDEHFLAKVERLKKLEVGNL
jgi:hypothetical protein